MTVVFLCQKYECQEYRAGMILYKGLKASGFRQLKVLPSYDVGTCTWPKLAARIKCFTSVFQGAGYKKSSKGLKMSFNMTYLPAYWPELPHGYMEAGNTDCILDSHVPMSITMKKIGKNLGDNQQSLL